MASPLTFNTASAASYPTSALTLLLNKSIQINRRRLSFLSMKVSVPADENDILADCLYGGHRLCASVEIGGVIATQFHPERSGKAGLAVLRRFIEI